MSNKQQTLFPDTVMRELMITKGLTPTAIQYFQDQGIKMEKCATCTQWRYLRFLFNKYEIAECNPCIKNTKEA